MGREYCTAQARCPCSRAASQLSAPPRTCSASSRRSTAQAKEKAYISRTQSRALTISGSLSIW